MASSQSGGPSVGGRKLVERLGAHIAFLLNNGNNGVVEVKTFALFTQLTALLAGRGSAGAAYRDGVLAIALAGADRSADELALAYFDRVLDRGMFLARDNHQHIAHELFELLCRRGQEVGWENTALSRGPGAGSGKAPKDFGIVADKLARRKQGVAVGNPAASTRAAHGPLMLWAGDGKAAEVAEELSAWGAIWASPEMQKVLPEGQPFDKLCSTVIKAIEAANAHYGALVRLGLPPLEWMDDISINTAKGLSAFVTDVKAKTGGPLEDRSAWTEVWAKRKIPGFKSLDALWDSELGRFLRRPVIARIGPATGGEKPSDDEQEIDEGTGEPPIVLDETSAAALAHEACEQGAISEFDVWLFEQVCSGKQLSEISRLAKWLTGPGAEGQPVATYVDQLRDRLLRWARAKQEDD